MFFPLPTFRAPFEANNDTYLSFSICFICQLLQFWI